MVPVLIRPDGSMTLTRWPNSRSMGECGTKTRWRPLSLLHDLPLELQWGDRWLTVSVRKGYCASFNVNHNNLPKDSLISTFQSYLYPWLCLYLVSDNKEACREHWDGVGDNWRLSRLHGYPGPLDSASELLCWHKAPEKGSNEWRMVPIVRGFRSVTKILYGSSVCPCCSHIPEQSSNTSPLSS